MSVQSLPDLVRSFVKEEGWMAALLLFLLAFGWVGAVAYYWVMSTGQRRGARDVRDRSGLLVNGNESAPKVESRRLAFLNRKKPDSSAHGNR